MPAAATAPITVANLIGDDQQMVTRTVAAQKLHEVIG
jgi:hypothetical protein